MPPSDVSGKAVNGAVVCGVASVVVRNVNRNRRLLILTNDSDVPIYLCYGDPAVVNSGIRLNALGGAIEISGYSLYRGVITAIAAGATKILCYSEVE